MPQLGRFDTLPTREKALVAIALLLDGLDAPEYLSKDRARGAALSRAAKDVADLSPDLRMPLLGSILRTALLELESSAEL